MLQIASLFTKALAQARMEGRDAGILHAIKLCDELARSGSWEQTVGAAECSTRLRAALQTRKADR